MATQMLWLHSLHPTVPLSVHACEARLVVHRVLHQEFVQDEGHPLQGESSHRVCVGIGLGISGLEPETRVEHSDCCSYEQGHEGNQSQDPQFISGCLSRL